MFEVGRVSAVRAAITRAQKWPGIAQPALWARTAGSSFVFGGVLVALITALTPTSFDHAVLQYANAAVAMSIGIAVLLTGRRVTLVQFHLLVVTAILLITLSVTFATGAAAVSFATLYVFVGCAAFFVAWPTAVLYLGLAMLCSTTALAVTGSVPWWTGLVTAATTAAVGVIILALGQVVAKAELDEVTGLPNRRGFDRILSAEVSRASWEKTGPAVVLICVDARAAVQQEFGDRAADALMQQLTSTWLAVLGPGHVLARRSDGELALMLPATTEHDAFALTQRLRQEATREFSAGVSAWAAGESSTPVLERADAALRRAQSIGRNRTMLESSELPPLAVQLSDALAAEDIGVCYQPVMRLDDPDVVIGVEALLRWSPALGPDLNAGEVIRVAEDHDLIAALDQFVLRRACLDAGWVQGRFPGLPLMLSVNVSGLELVKQGYARPGRGHAAHHRLARRPTRAGGHRDGPRRGPALVDQRTARAPPPRNPCRHRRLRHRILVVEPATHAADRPPQTRRLFRFVDHLAVCSAPAAGGRRTRRCPSSAYRGRRCRDRPPGSGAARHGLHDGPGLSFRPSAEPGRRGGVDKTSSHDLRAGARRLSPPRPTLRTPASSPRSVSDRDRCRRS